MIRKRIFQIPKFALGLSVVPYKPYFTLAAHPRRLKFDSRTSRIWKSGRLSSAMEQTFIMIKPDGAQRCLVGEIISRFEKKGFSLRGLKLVSVDSAFAEKHYADLSAKPFFNGLVEYIISGPVVAMVWEGKGVVKTGRTIIGATNPADSAPGTIRGDFAVDIGRNVIHGSDSVESARKEIALWFPEGVVEWQSSLRPWIYE
uniref:Nucleoside diphosphate kinase n=1 Tax=Kalanchoe fedtschenkoi TaxID=63787 RepID=A0A7N0T063_KALFE